MKQLIRIFALLLVLLSSAALPAQARPPIQEPTPLRPDPLLQQLRQETGDPLRISYHNETGQVRFVGTNPDQAITRARTLTAGAAPEAAALAFLDTYGPLFGLRSPAQELTVKRQQKADDGRSFVRWQQVYQGIPILGGELIVQMDAQKNVLSANGEILPGLGLDTTPTLSAQDARRAALDAVAKGYGLDAAGLTASEPALWIYNPALLGGPGPRISTLVWRTEVTPLALAPIRELVLVDAQVGGVALRFNQIDTARSRLTYTANNLKVLPGTLLCSEGGTCADPHAAAAHTYAGHTYDFYYTLHGRDSIDNAGMALISTVHYDDDYENAFWNGIQMVYGDGAGFPLADDVVAHELTHGVTEHESGLFYYYQSGAINEAFSDLWGEFLDQYGSTANDVGDARWEIGEDVTGWGAMRNMQDPTLHNDPDRMTSEHYYTGPEDNGGVHGNCGVNSKAAYLLTDGGSFNGQTVTALGYQKVARIYYEVQSHLLPSGGDYADMYDLLYQGCQNLVGSGGITAADCTEVRDATNAVEMNQQPAAGYNTEAPLCDAGQTPVDLWFDGLEGASSTYWTFGALAGTSRWQLDTWANWGNYAHSGEHSLFAGDWPGDISDSYAAMKTSVTLPANAYLHFAHAYGFEGPNYDGGVIEYSTNGGSTWTDAGSLFADGTNNPYDGALSTAYGNPLGGRQAFLDDSHGYIATRLNLSSLAGSGVRFRWRMGLDAGVSDVGWWVDDVRIYTCSVDPGEPAPLVYVITPNSGTNNGPLHITHLAGIHFQPGAAVKLTRTGQPDIHATHVSVTGNSQIACDLDLTGAVPGTWNVVVTNPDAQSGTLPNGLTVRGPAPQISSIAPISGTNDGSLHITHLAGTAFQPGAVVKLTRTGQPDIHATHVSVVGSSQIACDLDLTSAATGAWNVVVTNTDGQSGTLPNGFTVTVPGIQADFRVYLPLTLRNRLSD